MVLQDQLLADARAARDRLIDLQHEAELAQVEYHHALRVLHAAGGSMREIADALDLSHQRVHQIVGAGSTSSAAPAAVDPADPRQGRRHGGGGGPRRDIKDRDIKDRVRSAWWAGGKPRTVLVADARQAVELAPDEARALGHNYVGTEHMLLGLLRAERGLAGRLLESASVDLDDVRASVQRIIGRGQEPPAEGALPTTPRAKKVADLAIREAKRDRSEFARGEHLLLAVLREGGGVAAQILSGSDLGDYDALRKQVDRANLRCAFCERDGLQYDRCVAGPGVHICDACIAGASRLVADGETVAAEVAGRLQLMSAELPWGCSFCGKPNHRVDHLVGGPHAKICNECLDLCHEILAGQRKAS